MYDSIHIFIMHKTGKLPRKSVGIILMSRNCLHYLKSVCIWSFSGSYFPTFGERLRILSYPVCIRENMDQKYSPSTDTSYAELVHLFPSVIWWSVRSLHMHIIALTDEMSNNPYHATGLFLYPLETSCHSR